MENRKLPVGIEFFDEIRKENYYYIDKTGLIRELLNSGSKVTLFTRPRRFGKTLNMSMLKCFFEVGADWSLFTGLEISRNTDLCEKYLGKYPVVFLSLKDVDGFTFEAAKQHLVETIGREADRFHFLMEDNKLSDREKEKYQALVSLKKGQYCMDEVLLSSSLQLLSDLLYRYYEKKVILLIDEYDVPLDKAFQHGYYDEMVLLIRRLLGQALKTNNCLQFAVLTGCLRVARESIFTGLNNFRVLSITDAGFDEKFGFTDDEVRTLLANYGLSDHFMEMKEWYDGYHFGNADVYCPWDVINHVYNLRADADAQPETFWINTSSNDLVKRFIYKADSTTRDEIERLIAGEAVQKNVRLELTYNEVDKNIDNLWSVLFTTGYLTQEGSADRNKLNLVIPNKEIREIFVSQIQEWFQETAHSDQDKINCFCSAFPKEDTAVIQEMLNDYLWDSISIRDTAVRRNMKENFYHGLLLGLLRSRENWKIRSNAETGEGCSDISICTPERLGIVIEIKYAEDGNLEAACERALKQIEDRKYAEGLRRQGMKKVICYGISFCKKECAVEIEK